MTEQIEDLHIPQQVSIFGLVYKIQMVDRISRESSLDGEMSPLEQVIRIDRPMNPERAKRVFLHEVVHALVDQLGYQVGNEDERMVQGLAIGLHQALYCTISVS